MGNVTNKTNSTAKIKKLRKDVKDFLDKYKSFIEEIDKLNIMTNITWEKLEKFKTTLSGINNIITSLATLAIVEKIRNAYNVMDDDIEIASANAPGYDIKCENKRILGDKRILVEVKCNMPHLTTKFGGAQLTALEKDVDNLLNGKGKYIGKTGNDIKILAIVNFKDNGKSHIKGLKEQIQTKANKNPKTKDKVFIDKFELGQNLDSSKVYIYVLSEADLKNELDPVIKDWEKSQAKSEN